MLYRSRATAVILSIALSACSRTDSESPSRTLGPTGDPGLTPAANLQTWTAEVDATKPCVKPGETIRFILRVHDENGNPPETLERSTDFTIFMEEGGEVAYSGVRLMDEAGVSYFDISTAGWAEGNYYVNGWSVFASDSIEFKVAKKCTPPKRTSKTETLFNWLKSWFD